MKFTNKYNLPQPLYDALIYDDYEHGGDISVTGLIKPVRQYQLEKRHADEIVVDASDMLWSLLGKIGHRILENVSVPTGFKEERLYLNINGWKVAAKPDLWIEPHNLEDYKYTTVWSWIYGLKPEWEQQLNMYTPFYTIEAGFPVEALKINAIFRDHMKSKQKIDPKYPAPVMVMDVPLWTPEKQWMALDERVSLHQIYETKPDNDLLQCSPEERWEQPTKWAVMKRKRKKALRVFDNEMDAISYDAMNPDNYVVKRPGTSRRCEDYCFARPFCNQWKEIQEKEV